MSKKSTKITKPKRKNNGEGSIMQLKTGRFMGKIMIGRKADGSPNRPTIYGQTLAEVVNKINELKYEFNHGIYVEPNRTKFGEWLLLWLETYKQKKLKARTYDSYETQINANIIPAIGHIPLKDLNTNLIQQFYNDLYDDGNKLSSASVRKIHQIINSALIKAQAIDMIVKNPAAGVELPPLEPKLVKAFTVSEQEAFFVAAKDSDYCNAYIFAVNTGVREGELLPLCWSDIDFVNSRVSITKTLIYVRDRKGTSGNGYILKVQDSTKTKAGTRSIPLTESYLRILKEMKLKNSSKSQLVFPSRKGTFIEPRNFQRCFQNICKKAGLVGFNCHTLRHTFATRCFEYGIVPHVVKKWLGHKRLSHTQEIYTHVMPDKENEAIEKLERGTSNRKANIHANFEAPISNPFLTQF